MGHRPPDFFIVGHQKCGTTALYEALRSHPQLFMPQCKEPWFFADELHDRTPPRPEGTPRTLEEYLELYAEAAPEQLLGEASAQYLWSRSAAASIATVAPDARIVAILREPADFLRSLHLQFVQTYVETQGDFRQALSLEPQRREGRRIPRHTYWPRMLQYSCHVRYADQLRRYFSAFSTDRVLVLIYDDFRGDNAATIARVLDFLGVDDRPDLTVGEANPTVRVRSARAHELVSALSVGHGLGSRIAKASLKTVTPRGMRRRAVNAVKQRVLFTDAPDPDPELMRELRVRFRDEVAAVSELIGRDLLGLWKYDDDT